MNAVLLLAKLPDERIKGNSIVLNDKFKFTLDDVIQKPIVNADNTNIFLMHSEKDNKFCYDLFHDIFLQLLSNGQDCKYCVLGWKNDQTVYDFLGEKTLLKETNPTWNELDSLDLAKSVTSMYSADMSNPLAVCLDCSTTSWDSIKGQHEIRSSRLNVFVLKVEKDMNQVQKINNIIQNSHDDYTGLLYESDSTKFKNQIIGCIFDFENKFEDNLLVLETCNMLKSDLNQNAKPLNIELESSKEELNLLQSKIVLLESRLAEAVTLKEFEGDNYLKLELQHQIERNQQLETERDYMSTELTILRSGYLNSLKPSNASLHLKSSTESLDNSFTMAKLQRAASSSSIPWDQSGISFETEVTKDFMNHLNLELQLREMTRAAKYYKSKLVQLEAGSSREVLDDTEALKLELGNITVRSLQSQNKALRSILETKSLELVESEKRSLQIREESDSAKEVIKLKEFDLLKSQEKLKRAMNSLKILEESVISNEPTRDVNLASKIDFQSQLYHEMSAANQKLIEERDQLKIRNLYLEETQLTLSKALENYKMTVGELEGRVKETEDMKYLRTPTEFSDQISDVSVSRIPRLKRLSNNSFSLDRASISSMSNDGHMARRNSNASTDILSRADSSGLTEKLRSYADVSDKIKDSTFERGAINIPQYKVPAVEDGTLTKASFSRVKNRMLEENLLHDFIHQEFSKEREKLVEELISCKQYISEMETKLTVSQAAMGEQHGSLTRVLEQAKEDLTFIKEQLQQEKIHNSELSEQLTIERSRLAISQKDNITMKDTMSKQVEDLQNKKVVIEGLEVELENFKSKATILEDKLNQLNTIKITNESLKANLDACNLKLISTTQRRDELEKLVISSKKKQMATENQLITSGADLSNCKVEIKRLNELIQQTKSDSADVKERALIDDMTKLKASTEDLESRLKSANVKRLALEDEKLELQEVNWQHY
ncbi:hypothetical protein BC833DRAFT_123417 [Globomyces pollinis-pini]|nr:hypothetical protein BC833DRAFT_123417 [Globomyces pollinis-pini]